MIKLIADPLVTNILAELLVLFTTTNVRTLGEVTEKYAVSIKYDNSYLPPPTTSPRQTKVHMDTTSAHHSKNNQNFLRSNINSRNYEHELLHHYCW